MVSFAIVVVVVVFRSRPHHHNRRRRSHVDMQWCGHMLMVKRIRAKVEYYIH